MSRGYGRDNMESRGAYRQTDADACPACGATDWWQSAYDQSVIVCRRCHPPVPGAEKVDDGRGR